MTNSYPMSRVIAAGESAVTTTWQPPVVDGPRAGRLQRPTLSELEDIERIAWDEAYAKGLQAGQVQIDQKLAALNEQAAQLASLMRSLAQPLAQMDVDVEQQLMQLVFAISRHVVRRELRMAPAQIIAIVRDTVGLLPLSQRNVRVYLHPLDAALLREKLAEPQSEHAWTIVEDPVMARGGCRVSTDTAQIDARLDTQLAVAFNHLLGEERNDATRANGTDEASEAGDA